MKQKWISVRDILPDMREVYKGGPRTSAPVLVYDADRGIVTMGRYEDHSDKPRSTGWWIDTQPDWANIQDRESITASVSHWMPLPEGPKP